MAGMDLKTVPLPPSLGDLPEAMQDIKDERRRRFAWEYVFNGAQGAAAARVAGYSDEGDGCKVRAHHLLQRDDVMAGIAALTTRYLFSLAPKAVLRLEQLLDDPKHPKHDKAIDMALSRSGHGERSQVDVNVSGSVTLNHTDSSIEDLRQLMAIGAPRAKLIEAFGASGLERYERMLADKVLHEKKVIEHRDHE
jgi:hypothetical protein